MRNLIARYDYALFQSPTPDRELAFLTVVRGQLDIKRIRLQDLILVQLQPLGVVRYHSGPLISAKPLQASRALSSLARHLLLAHAVRPLSAHQRKERADALARDRVQDGVLLLAVADHRGAVVLQRPGRRSHLALHAARAHVGLVAELDPGLQRVHFTK